MKDLSRMLKHRQWEVVPFLLIALVIPVAVLHIPVAFSGEMSDFLAASGVYDDYFHLTKGLILYLATTMLFILFLAKPQRPVPREFLPFIPYSILVLLSVCFSGYKLSAVFGVLDHYEGALTQWCYVLILIFSFTFFTGEDEILLILKLVLSASVVVALIGVLQFSGVEFIGRILPGYSSQNGLTDISRDAPGISSTIGNSNYTGTYGAILLPLSVTLVLLEKSRLKKWLSLLFYFGAAFFLMVGSLSRASYFASVASCFLMVVFLGKSLKKQFKWVLAALSYAVLIFLAMNTVSEGRLMSELDALNPFASESAETGKLIFRNIQLKENAAVIETNKWVLTVRNAEEGFLFEDGSGNFLPTAYDQESGSITLAGKPYEGICAFVGQQEDMKWIYLGIEGKDLDLVYTGGRMMVAGYNGMLTDVFPAEAFAPIKNEAFASGRGYIWSRSIPLLKGAVLWGYGPDVFPFIFPQNDIVGKLNYGAIWAIIGKPHSWYLQVALGSGVLSLVCLAVFFGWYIMKTIKVFRRERSNEERKLAAFGILLSVFAFLTAGIFNDSVVSVSPIFWMITGFGVRLLLPEGN